VILKAAKDDAVEVRIASMEALAVIGEPSAVSMLAETAASASTAEVERTAARNALDRMSGQDADKAIVAALSAAPAGVKLELIRTAGERGIREAAGPLLASLRDSDRTVRREAYRALRETAGEPDVPALLELLKSAASESDRREIERALSSALRRSPAARSADVASAYRSSTDAIVRASLLQVMGQAGTAEVLPVLQTALDDSSPDLVRAAILGLTEWPDDQPLKGLLAFAGKASDQAHQILAVRGVLKLLALPSMRPAGETVGLLAKTMDLSRQPQEKKTVLALLAQYPTKEALQLAQSAAADPAVASEAKVAAQRIQRALPK
jgi:HEAT repeat protein